MKISALEEHEYYNAAACKGVKAILSDGKELPLSGCITTINTDEGWYEKYSKNEDGEFVLSDNKQEIVIERVYAPSLEVVIKDEYKHLI